MGRSGIFDDSTLNRLVEILIRLKSLESVTVIRALHLELFII